MTTKRRGLDIPKYLSENEGINTYYLNENLNYYKKSNVLVEKLNNVVEISFISRNDSQFEFMIKFDKSNQSMILCSLLKLKVNKFLY